MSLRRATPRRPRRPRPRPALVAALVLGPALAGCYTYEVAEPPAPVPGQAVRVELTGSGQDRLRAARALDMEALDGRFVSSDAQELAVQVRLDANRLGFGTLDVVDTIRVARQDVRSVGVKELSVGRSLLVAAGVVAVAAGAYAAFGSGDGGEPGPDPGEEIILVPVSLSSWLGGVLGALSPGR